MLTHNELYRGTLNSFRRDGSSFLDTCGDNPLTASDVAQGPRYYGDMV